MEERLKDYLDMAIRKWRKIRDDVDSNEEERQVSIYYIAAFQSVRMSMFGELLEG